jgi:hypothetical protein
MQNMKIGFAKLAIFFSNKVLSFFDLEVEMF